MTDPFQIEFARRCPLVPLDETICQKLVTRGLREAGFQQGTLSIAILDDAEIQDIHQRYLGSDQTTDVITFPLESSGDRLEGEILVNAEMAARRCAEFGWSAASELLFYLAHGVLHLCGQQDGDDASRAAMHAEQYRLLQSVGVNGPTPSPR